VRFSAPIQTGPGAHSLIWYGVYTRGKAAEACIDHPPPLSIEVKERDEIYL